MMEFFNEFALSFWALLAEMAPYLWAGIAITFLLKWLVNPSIIRRHLGGEGFRPVLLATLAGLPLPLCSCGVLPVAAAIRREGGGRAGVAAFTVSTPQTGVDSVLATAGLLGWGMALLRLLTALVSGLLSGFLVGLFPGKEKINDPSLPVQPSCCGKTANKISSKDSSCCEEKEGACAAPADEGGTFWLKVRDASNFAFVRLPADIAIALLFGTSLAALVLLWTPDWSSELIPGGNLGAYALVSLFALPVYVCSTGVIPLAFGLIAAGFPAGAAFILLTAGPSVSATSLLTLGKLVGCRATIITATTLLAVTWGVGALVDFSPLAVLVPDCTLHEAALPVWRHASAAALLLLLVNARLISAFSDNSTGGQGIPK